VKGVGIKKGVEQTRAPDIRDNGDLLAGKSHVLKSLVQSVNDFFVGTARAKYQGATVVQ
jgi:hypothetical protein